MKKSLVLIMLFVGAVFIFSACEKKEKIEEDVFSMENILGNWEGAIQIPETPLPITIQFGEKNSTISIPVQGLNEYPLENVKLTEPALSFDMLIQGQRIAFAGKVIKDNISGTFKQNGQQFPFELTKASPESVIDKGETVKVKVSDGEMVGVLEKPEGNGPFPVMIIIAGSGPTDHNGNSILLPGKNNSLKMLAEDLAKQGVASIRYDKRGVGENAHLVTKENLLTFDQYIDDVASFIEYAKNDKLFSKIGIIGHSEGSLVGMVAANKKNIDVFISIAGAGRPINEVLIEQLQVQLSGNLLEESKTILRKLAKKEQVANVSMELQSIFRPSVQPYLISWLAYNPSEEIQKLNCLVLIINGTNDIQVPVSDAEALYNSKVASSLLIIKDMNHILKEAPANREGNIGTYSDPNLPLAKGLVDGIVEFIK
ncbi:alpha/beta hydrolase family protein [Psychrobacillus sp. NPDC058041]|uniref:alpha/beta hydrolase family protein n=1 Tax=Psychrobacillus sp. NPDC058041 TaxID=3346310 RepID=UPI0036DC0CAB